MSVFFPDNREEEIKNKAGSIADGIAQHYVPRECVEHYREGFIDGAKWADKTLMDKVIFCLRLLENEGLSWSEDFEDRLKHLISI